MSPLGLRQLVLCLGQVCLEPTRTHPNDYHIITTMVEKKFSQNHLSLSFQMPWEPFCERCLWHCTSRIGMTSSPESKTSACWGPADLQRVEPSSPIAPACDGSYHWVVVSVQHVQVPIRVWCLFVPSASLHHWIECLARILQMFLNFWQKSFSSALTKECIMSNKWPNSPRNNKVVRRQH